MRIIVVGATGMIGTPLAAALAERHEVVRVGNRHGDFQVDVADTGSIARLFQDAGPFDALSRRPISSASRDAGTARPWTPGSLPDRCANPLRAT